MDLKKLIREAISKNLKENNFFDDEYIEKWISGECIPFTLALNEIVKYKKTPSYKTHDEFTKDIEKFDSIRYQDYLKGLDDYHHKIYNKKYLTPEEIDNAIFIVYELYKMKKPAPIHIYNSVLNKLRFIDKISEYNYNILIKTNERLYSNN
jgi:hypothetical protein